MVTAARVINGQVVTSDLELATGAPVLAAGDPPIPAPPATAFQFGANSALGTWQSVAAAIPEIVVIPAAQMPGMGPLYDDATAINWALNETPSVGLLAAPYQLFTPIQLNDSNDLHGIFGGAGGGASTPTAVTMLQLNAAFSGTGAIILPDGAGNMHLSGFFLDGHAPPAGTAHGIYAAGTVPQVVLERITMRGIGLANGVNVQVGAGKPPFGWRGQFVHVSTVTGAGFFLNENTDSDWVDCLSISAGSDGWQLINMSNSKLIGCRGEWSVGRGFHINGAWQTGIGSSDFQMSGCSTDRNGQDGVRVDATGNSPVVITGMMTRRDGAGNPANNYGGIHVDNSTLPVVISGWTCYTGVNDDGTGNDSPEYGLSLTGTNTLVAVSAASLHAVTAGINGSSGASYRNVWTRTGPTSSPTSPVLTPDTA